jgi:hypothetical protein
LKLTQTGNLSRSVVDKMRERFTWPGFDNAEAVHKGTAYLGEHAAIIDRALWDRVHAIMQQSPRKRASNTRAQTPALLEGLLFGRAAPRSRRRTRGSGTGYTAIISAKRC